MNELLKQYNELLAKIAAKSSLGDKLTDDDADQLDEWNHQAKALKARIEAQELAEEHAKNEAERIEREKEQAIREAVKAERERAEAANRRIPGGDAPYVAKYSDTYKYDQLDAAELSLAMSVGAQMGVPFSQGAYKSLALRIAEMDPKKAKDAEERKGFSYVKNAFKAATSITPEMDQVEAAIKADAIKADAAPMYTGASPMSDWVGTAYAEAIWRKIRGEVVIANRIPSDTIPDGYSSKYWPLESTDPTWYKVAEAAATDSTLRVPDATMDSSAAATSSKQLTLGKMGARVLYTQEAVEDSLVRLAPQLQEQLTRSGMEQLEHVIVDGDVETSANKNINDIAGTPAGTETFLLFDGFRKLALVTNTANSRSANGGFVVEDFKDTAKLLGVAGVAAADPTGLGFIIDYNTMWAAMDLPELKTRDTFARATLENGVLTRVYNIPVLNSYQMHLKAPATVERLANTSGKVDVDTAGNNTTGAILAVRFDQWKIAYKRRMTIEVTRLARSDSWEIVALMRFGFGYRDTEASAITYNVGV